MRCPLLLQLTRILLRTEWQVRVGARVQMAVTVIIAADAVKAAVDRDVGNKVALIIRKTLRQNSKLLDEEEYLAGMFSVRNRQKKPGRVFFCFL